MDQLPKQKDVTPAKGRDRCEAAKAAFAKNVHVKRVSYLLNAAVNMANDYPNISRAYIRELREIANKHVIRLDPSFKLNFCKGCNTVTLPGINAVYTAECHQEWHRNVPGNQGVRDATSCAPEMPGHYDKPPDDNQFDELSYDWLAVTCCVCTRTRRTKLKHPEVND
ncbi:RNAse P protein subunit domain containing protein, putative [Babesia bigemina]|uniref:RNAse P protein subunit domain containing protein, putative n=1 Tax=Babesia bigemina TaxID=5866 RepID=A0A061D5S2_BABBI|nr:RNAse P protein subunit domain containing protein, putative [Babesia bigemina]CDR94284.1 RNAse P protein subunit domain containing protein, putative [Babesia bigemina]|eukprot:XP_012766470.1 RNAse P protein subunit domain containing protein, putative [Babesia bigemina]